MSTTTSAVHSARFRHTKTPGELRFFSLGDVHLGHHQTPTQHIIQNLERYCTSLERLEQIDLLIITGDLFDRLLNNGDENVHLINRWITKLLYKCAAADVAVRIVEGTPSHDRKQSRFFVEQKHNANIPVDLYYATTLELEYLERFDLHVLYLPDKYKTPDVALTEAKLLLHQRGLEQADLAIMHGAFTYQLPSIVKEPTHDAEAWLSLVRYFILIGHVHLMSQYQRILAAGSFDRICHGEEGPKGYFDVRLRHETNYQITFVENKGAKRYDTLNCHGLDTKALHAKLTAHLATLPKHSAVRLRCNPQDPISAGLDELKKLYPHYEWQVTVESRDKPTVLAVDLLDDSELSAFTPITADTLVELMRTELARHLPADVVAAPYLQRLGDVIHGLVRP